MIKIYETTDLDELTAAQEQWEIRHCPVNTGRFRGRLSVGRVSNIQIDLEQWNVSLELIGTSPRDGLALVLPLHDEGSYRSSGQEVTTDRIDVFRPGCEIFAQTKPGCDLISCTLPADSLDPLTDTPLETLLTAQPTGHSVLQSHRRATSDLRFWWLKLLDLSTREEVDPQAQDQLFRDTLLMTAQALREGEEDRGTRTRRSFLLARRARDFMLERQANPASLLDVCLFLNVSERTLHNVFHDTYGISPKRFLKAQRLFAARQALKFTSTKIRVSDVALSLGFLDLGRFARDYRDMFGELPSATLASGRS